MFIDSIHARVVLPDAIRPTRTAVYTGYKGSTASDAVIRIGANEVDFTSRHPLYPYAGMTVAVGWPAGFISGRPSEMHERVIAALRWLPLLIPFIVFFLALGVALSMEQPAEVQE